MNNGEQKTNVIWIVPKEDFCSKCGYAVYGRETRPGYTEAMGYYGGAPDGQITHMQCPGEPFFPPLAKRADSEES